MAELYKSIIFVIIEILQNSVGLDYAVYFLVALLIAKGVRSILRDGHKAREYISGWIKQRDINGKNDQNITETDPEVSKHNGFPIYLKQKYYYPIFVFIICFVFVCASITPFRYFK
jgi:hypothetical protein